MKDFIETVKRLWFVIFMGVMLIVLFVVIKMS